MTEIQRIKKTGWLSNSFFKPEIKCEFYITEERKMIWAILLDLLREFQRICSLHDLTYFAICGSALGAVRHNGFIPWDDDIDVAMPRPDYEKLKQLKNEFKFPYNLVWPETEQENGYSYIKLRNSNTSGLSIDFSNLKIDHGLFLDIFPLDKAEIDSYILTQERIKELIIQNSRAMKLVSYSRKMNLDSNIERGIFLNCYKEIEGIAKKDNLLPCNKLALRTISFYSPEKLIWDKEIFIDFLEVPFEEINIKIPIGWEKLLETNYGEWKQFPPLENRGNWHNNVIFDPLRPFQYYINDV